MVIYRDSDRHFFFANNRELLLIVISLFHQSDAIMTPPELSVLLNFLYFDESRRDDRDAVAFLASL